MIPHDTPYPDFPRLLVLYYCRKAPTLNNVAELSERDICRDAQSNCSYRILNLGPKKEYQGTHDDYE